MATIFSDDFNRANSTTLGNGWTEITTDFQIVSNQLKNTGGTGLAYNSVDTGSANYSVSAKVLAYIGNVLARMASDGSAFYLFQINVTNGTTIDLYRYQGSWNLLAQTTFTVSSGDTIKISANGSSIKGYVNGVEKVSATDGNITAQNYPGVRSYASGADYGIMDDFLVEDLSAGSSVEVAKINGIALSSIAKWNGIALTSIAKINGKTIQ